MPGDPNAPVIVGVGMTAFGRQPDSTLKSLAGEATSRAMADAGITAEALECVFAANAGAGIVTGQESVRGQVSLKEIGVGGVPLFNVENACATGSTGLHLAVHYLKSGAAQTALVLGYEKMTAPDKSLAFKAIEACGDVDEIRAIKESLGPEGAGRSLFMDYYAEKVRAYMERTGATKETLAWVAAKNHSNGVRNDYAQFKQEQTVETVLESREIVDPLHLLMCSPISDGAAAIILATPEWAAAHGKSGPTVAATKLRSDSFSATDQQVRAIAQEAYDAARLSPDDVDVAEVHDGSAPGEIFAYEDLGLAEADQGWRLAADGETAADGRVPVNTGGGLLARGHPIGATGVAQICELAWQLRGEAGARQVSGASVAAAHCLGGQASFGKTTGGAAMSVALLTA